MKKRLIAALALLFLLLGVAWVWPHSRPSENQVREQFERHRADYIRFVTLLRNDHAEFVGGFGEDADSPKFGPEIIHLVHKIGAKEVMVREDGSVEFALWGHGCAICSDSYTGVRYYPKDHHGKAGWMHSEVTSLDDAKLPQENGSVASGLYVVPIEPEWFVYRFEYQE